MTREYGDYRLQLPAAGEHTMLAQFRTCLVYARAEIARPDRFLAYWPAGVKVPDALRRNNQ